MWRQIFSAAGDYNQRIYLVGHYVVRAGYRQFSLHISVVSGIVILISSYAAMSLYGNIVAVAAVSHRAVRQLNINISPDIDIGGERWQQ